VQPAHASEKHPLRSINVAFRAPQPSMGQHPNKPSIQPRNRVAPTTRVPQSPTLGTRRKTSLPTEAA
jgi:hypothetical protein